MTIAKVTYVIGRNFCRKEFLWRKVVLRKYIFFVGRFFSRDHKNQFPSCGVTF